MLTRAQATEKVLVAKHAKGLTSYSTRVRPFPEIALCS